MKKYQKALQELLKQQLSRKQFLHLSFMTLLSVIGVTRMLESLSNTAVVPGKETFGEGGYGGYLLGDANDPMQARKKRGVF